MRDQRPEVTSISRFNPVTRAFETYYRTGAGVNFNVVSGEGYEIQVSANTTIVFAGTFTPFTMNLTSIGSHLISVPYNATYANARAIVDSLNGAPAPGTTLVIKRLNPATQQFESLTWVVFGPIGGWAGTNFNFVPGEAYSIQITGATTWTPTVY